MNDFDEFATKYHRDRLADKQQASRRMMWLVIWICLMNLPPLALEIWKTIR